MFCVLSVFFEAKAPGKRASMPKGHIPKGHADNWRPRSDQGWLNRFVHLAVLVEMGQTDEARTYVQTRLQRSAMATGCFQSHLYFLQRDGYDHSFGVD